MDLAQKELRRANGLLTILAVLAAGFLLLALRGVLLPLAIAFFLSYLGMPVIRLGRRIRCPVPIIVLVVILLLAGATGGMGLVFYTSVEQFKERLPRYRERLVELSNRVLRLPQLEAYVERVEKGEPPKPREGVPGTPSNDEGAAEGAAGEPGSESEGPPSEEGADPAVVDPNLPSEASAPETPQSPEDETGVGEPGTEGAVEPQTGQETPASGAARSASPQPPTFVREISWEKILRSGGLVDVAGDVLGGFGNAMLVLVFLIFILLDRARGDLDRRIVAAFSREGTDSARPALEEIHREIENYLVTKTLISLVTGGLVAFLLALLDLPFALLFGLLAFTLNYIPNVGWVIASVPPLLVAAVHFDDFVGVLEVGALLLTVHGVLGFLDPMITGKRLHLNPTTVLVSLVIWGWLWGAWGMVLAVPIAAVIRISSERAGVLRGVSALMTDT